MARRISNDTLLVAGALLFGLFSLSLPFLVAVYGPERPPARVKAAARDRETLVRNQRAADLRRESLAFPGGCAVGEFKDGRQIAETIRRQFPTRNVRGVEVEVDARCVAILTGEVGDTRERDRAVRAASHPWVRAIDIAGLRVRDAE